MQSAQCRCRFRFCVHGFLCGVCVCPDYMPIIDTSWGMPATPCPMVRRHSRHFAGPGHTHTSILFVCTSPHAHLSAPRQWLLRRSGTACAMGLAGIPEDTAREGIHRIKIMSLGTGLGRPTITHAAVHGVLCRAFCLNVNISCIMHRCFTHTIPQYVNWSVLVVCSPYVVVN